MKIPPEPGKNNLVGKDRPDHPPKRDIMKRVECFAVYIVLLLILMASQDSLAASPGKRILGLYKSNEGATSADNPVLNHLSSTLRSLGYEIDYRDAIGALPGNSEMKKYEAVISFYFTGVHPHAREYIRWLKEQISAGKKVILFGNFGAHTEDGEHWLSKEELNDFFFLLGVAYRDSIKVDPADIKVTQRDARIFETLPNGRIEYVTEFDSLNRDNRIYLGISLKSRENSESVAVLRTPWGGMAQPGWLYEESPAKIDWKLNRTAFLREILDYRAANLPREKKMLGLFKGSDKQSEEDNLIRKFAAGPLFKLGCTLDYRDIEKGVPDGNTMEGYSGIISWYTSPSMERSPQYCQWLADNLAQGRKIIIMGNFGAYAERIKSGRISTTRFLSDHEINNFFYPFGLRMEQMWTPDSALIRRDFADGGIMNLALLKEPSDFKNYFLFRSILPGNRPCLTLSRKDIPDSGSDVVVTTPYGGMALETYIYRQNSSNWEITPILNLESFLGRCLEPGKFTPPAILEIKVDEKKALASVTPRQDALPPEEPGLIPRKVLILNKGSEVQRLYLNPFYQYSGPALEYLGIAADYVDIEKEKPDDEAMKGYCAILSWFTSPSMIDAEGYNRWLLHQVDSGRKIIILGNYGAFNEKGSQQFAPGSKKVFERTGSTMIDEYSIARRELKYVHNDLLTLRPLDRQMAFAMSFEYGRPDRDDAYFYDPEPHLISSEKSLFNFEAPLKLQEISGSIPVRSSDSRNKILLEVSASENGEITPACTGAWGGYALGNFFYREEKVKGLEDVKSYPELLNRNLSGNYTGESDKGKWVMNPFDFLNRALATDDMPRLDYSILNGQRLFFTHMDGDGFTIKSTWEPSKLAGEVFIREIIERYNIPFSASVITEELEENGAKYYNYPLLMSRRLFSLDNVEIATHSHTHPFNLTDGDISEVQLTSGGGSRGYHIKETKPSTEKEVIYSAALLDQNAAPAGKKTEAMFWPGMCNPTVEMIEAADKMGLANINGGRPLFDREHDSYSNLCPSCLQMGGRIQVNSPASNDYIYTGAWKGDYGAMKKYIETIDRSESPLIVCPIDVYCHYYSGMYKESIDALKSVYDYILKKHVAPVFASQYSDIIRDFCRAEVGRTNDGGYWIHNLGYLRTVRFDNTGKSPDLGRCSNVIGFNYINNTLYVFLNGAKEHRIYLTSATPEKVYLKSASHYIDSWKGDTERISAELRGLGPGFMAVANLSPATAYEVRLGGLTFSRSSNEKGLLEFNYELKGKPQIYTLEIKKL